MDNILFNLGGNDNMLLYIDTYLNSIAIDNPIKVGMVEIKKFSDEEISINLLESVRGKKVFLLIAPQNSDAIMTLMLGIDSAKRSGAKEIIPVLPYYPYARGDKKDLNRGPIGAKIIAQMLEANGATGLITFELHASQIEGFFKIPVIHIEGKSLFSNIFSEFNENMIFCAPDAGAGKRVEHLIDAVKSKFGYTIPYVIINKTRKEANVVDNMVLIGDVKGKDVYIYDDMGDTCGTVIKATETLLSKGAKSVNVMLSHALFSGINTIDELNKSNINKIYISDSLGEKGSDKIITISCGELIAKAILSFVGNKSYEELI